MTATDKEKVFTYLQEQIAQANFRTKAYVFDENNKKNPTRNCYVKLKKYLNQFIDNDKSIRWLIIPGLRGVGKTTLLAQLYFNAPSRNVNKLFLSVDHLTQMLNFSLFDVLSAYEELLGIAFERIDTPVLIFLDEVHYDKKWAITLKTFYDRTPNIFFIVTGSSALSIQTNPDVARRAVIEKLYPMCFTEYMKVKGIKYEIKGLSKMLRQTIFESNTAEEVYLGLKKSEITVRQYWAGIERMEINRYLQYGTLPFAVKLKNEGLAYDQIKKVIDRIIGLDIVEISQFSSDIISRIPEVLYAISSSDMLSLNNLSQDLGIHRNTLMQILEILEKTEMVMRVYPYGAHISQVKKPSKYLFCSPAFRSMYFKFIGSVIKEDSYKGKLLEDLIGLYMSRYASYSRISLTHDSSANGADFIVQMNDKNIVLEVGSGEKGFAQVANTMKRVSSKYGMIFSMSPLQLFEDKMIVSVPLSYFLLT